MCICIYYIDISVIICVCVCASHQISQYISLTIPNSGHVEGALREAQADVQELQLW